MGTENQELKRVDSIQFEVFRKLSLFMKKLKFGHYYILFFILLLGFIYIRQVRIENEINNYGKDIVVKFVKKEYRPKTTNFYFSYYTNNSLITTSGSGVKYSILNSDKETKSIDSLKINSYYLAKFNTKYPNNIKVNLDKEITDTIEIQKFGFNMKEGN